MDAATVAGAVVLWCWRCGAVALWRAVAAAPLASSPVGLPTRTSDVDGPLELSPAQRPPRAATTRPPPRRRRRLLAARPWALHRPTAPHRGDRQATHARHGARARTLPAPVRRRTARPPEAYVDRPPALTLCPRSADPPQAP